jgi:hypothetical protein
VLLFGGEFKLPVEVLAADFVGVGVREVPGDEYAPRAEAVEGALGGLETLRVASAPWLDPALRVELFRKSPKRTIGNCPERKSESVGISSYGRAQTLANRSIHLAIPGRQWTAAKTSDLLGCK